MDRHGEKSKYEMKAACVYTVQRFFQLHGRATLRFFDTCWIRSEATFVWNESSAILYR